MQWWSGSAARDALGQAQAVSKSQAVIEFATDGTIITAGLGLVASARQADAHGGEGHHAEVATQ